MLNKLGRNEQQAQLYFPVKLTWLVFDWLLNFDNESDNKPVTAETYNISSIFIGLILKTMEEINKLTHVKLTRLVLIGYSIKTMKVTPSLSLWKSRP